MPKGWLQTTTENYPINFTSSTPKGKSQQATDTAEVDYTSFGQPPHSSSYTVVMINPHSQLACSSTPSRNIPIGNKAELQHNLHKVTWATSSGGQGDCATGPHRTYITYSYPTKSGRHNRLVTYTKTGTEWQPKWGNKCPK